MKAIHLGFSILLILASGCNGVGVARVDEVGAGGTGQGGSGTSTISFAGLSSIDQKTDSTLRLNWSAVSDAAAYHIFNVTSGTAVWIQTVTGSSSTNVTLTGLTPSATYRFRVRAMDSGGDTDANTNDTGVTMNSAPNAPSALTLVQPSASPSINATPRIRVSGVKAGDTVRLYSDSSCATQVASGTASGTTIELVTSSVAPGAHTFYARAINSVPNPSACSTVSLAYTRTSCPTNYIPVMRNTDLGTSNDFCVAKYEMRDDGSGNPESRSSGTPWVNITHPDAKTECASLNALNGVTNKYFLMSNAEWMTIARDVERVDANWSSGTAGQGMIARGHTDNSAGVLAASTDNDPYFGTGDSTSSGWDQRRTLTLSTGDVIWDFAGNVWDWIDWYVPPSSKAYVSTDGAPLSGFISLNTLDTNIGSNDVMKPTTWEPYFSSLGATDGIGQYFAGDASSGGLALRGGVYDAGINNGGAYALNLSTGTAFTANNVSFRCVYRP